MYTFRSRVPLQLPLGVPVVKGCLTKDYDVEELRFMSGKLDFTLSSSGSLIKWSSASRYTLSSPARSFEIV